MSNNSYIESFIRVYPLLLIFTVVSSISILFLMKLQSIYYYIILLSIVITISYLFLLFSRNLSSEFNDVHVFSLNNNLLTQLYLIIFIWSVIYLVITKDRSLLYMFSLLLLYLIIFVQIFTYKASSSVILTEIAASMLLFIYGVTFIYPLYFGYTDTLPHIHYATIIADTGRTLPESMVFYSKFPLYHILIAASSHINNLDVAHALFLITAPIYVVVLFFLYMLFYFVSNNKQISLLSCLVYSWSSEILFHGTYMVTRVLAFVFFVILFYLYYRINARNNISNNTTNKYFKLFIVLFTLSIVLAHQVSAAQISILLIMFLLCEYLSRDNGYVSVTSATFFNVFFISYWIYLAHDFTLEVIGKRVSSFIYTDNLIIQYNVNSILNENLQHLLFSNMDVYISLFFALIGVKYLISYQSKSKSKAAFGLFSLACFMFYFPSPLKLLWKTMELLQFDRFSLFVFPFISLSVGVGVYIVIKSLFTNKLKTLCCIAIVLIPLFFSFVSITNSNTNSNFIYDKGPRNYFTQQEIDGFNYLDTYASSDACVFSDYFSQRYLLALTPKNYLSFSYLNSSEIPGSVNYTRNYFYIRDKAFEENGLYFGVPNSGEQLYVSHPSDYQNNSLNNDMFTKNKIYSNPYANLYFNLDSSRYQYKSANVNYNKEENVDSESVDSELL